MSTCDPVFPNMSSSPRKRARKLQESPLEEDLQGRQVQRGGAAPQEAREPLLHRRRAAARVAQGQCDAAQR